MFYKFLIGNILIPYNFFRHGYYYYTFLSPSCVFITYSFILAHTALFYHFSVRITCTLLFHCLFHLDFPTLAMVFFLVSAVTVGCVSTFEDLVGKTSGEREQAMFVFRGLGYLINMIFSSSSIYLKSL